MNVSSFYSKKEKNSQLLLKNSQLLLANKFQFIHPYDMEPSRDVVEFESGIEWHTVPFDDEEWCYMLNRQEYLLDLCVSFEHTGNLSYLKKGKHLIVEWIKGNQDTKQWRTIDTGIRLTYWKVMIDYLKNNQEIKPEELKTIEKSVIEQLHYLDDYYIEKYHLSNWGVLITSGYFLIQTVFKEIISDEMNQRMLERLSYQIQLQIQPTGNHWEQSPLYFLEVLRSFVFLNLSCAIDDEQVNQELERIIIKMYQYMLHFVTPKGTTILQGDTDEMMIEDMIQSIGILYQQEIPLMFTKKVVVDYMTLYLSGKEITYENWRQSLSSLETSDHVTNMFDDETGNYYIRSSWDSKSDYLHIYNGPLGSGHGHLSLGHVDVGMRGENLLVDSGRFTYVESDIRYDLKRAIYHNTVIINEKPFGTIVDSWGFKNVPTSLYNRSYEGDDYSVIRTMYLEEQETAFYKIVRTIIYFKKMKDYLIVDQVIPSKKETTFQLNRYFHFSPCLNLKLDKNRLIMESSKLESPIFGYVSEKDIALVDTVYGKMYNTLIPKQTLMTSSQQYVQTLYLTARQDVKVSEIEVKKSDGKEAVSSKCFGLKVTYGGDSMLIYSSVEDTFEGHKLYLLEDIPVYGQVGVHHKNKKTTQRLI